jgi:hypothetical protein
MAVRTGALAPLRGLKLPELRTARLYSADGRPLPMYVRYLGGVWQAFAPREEVPEVARLGALSVQVTAWDAETAARALHGLLARLGAALPEPAFARA